MLDDAFRELVGWPAAGKCGGSKNPTTNLLNDNTPTFGRDTQFVILKYQLQVHPLFLLT